MEESLGEDSSISSIKCRTDSIIILSAETFDEIINAPSTKV
jgi:hypothetical protein